MHSRRRYYPALVGDATCPAHTDAVRLTQPIGFHALLRGNCVIPIEYTIPMQQRRRTEHHHVAST